MSQEWTEPVWPNAFADFTCLARFDGKHVVLESASEGFVRVTGYTVEEFNLRGGVPFAIPPEDIFTVLQGLERLVDGKQAAGEVRMITRQGSTRWLRYLALPERDPTDPTVLLIHGAAQDVTERRHAGQLLAEAEDRFRQLAENIGEVFWMSDQLRTQILYVSPAYEEVWGRSCRSLYQEPWSLLDAVHPEDREAVAAVLERQGKGQPTDHEYRIVRPDGSVRWVRDRTFPVKGPLGEAYRVAGLAADVTERKRLEEQLRQAQKMEAVGRLAGGVAHDFNNLLTVINGYSELLLHDPEVEESVRQVLNEIHKAGARAARLTQQLLAFGRRAIVQPRALNLNALLEEMESMFRRLIGEDVELSVVAGAELAAVQVDRGLLEQVLLNLVVNARDAMPRGGRLTLETGNTYLDHRFASEQPELRAGPYVLLAVTDSGVGMDRQTLAQIFEPFFTTKGVGQGTGLGLAMVYGIVKQSEGHIEVHSRPGRGTTFRIYLPAVAGPEVRVSPAVKPRPLPTGTETVLLVEDEDGVRAFARRALEGCGYRVLEARDGPAALAVAAAWGEPIPLLVTDVVLPGMSGRELAGRLLARAPRMKVLYASGYTDDAVLRHGVRAEEQVLLEKPFTPAALAHKVREVLDGR